MATAVLPPRDDWAALAPDPSWITWRKAGDPRLVAGSGYALLLQVTHPVVGAGVADHSSFRDDPWGRLLRTLDYVNGTIYGGPEMAGEIGARVRAMHRSIKGTRPDGTRYHALDPEAYAWVHVTLAKSIVDGHATFGAPLDAAEREQLWQEWIKVGRFIGVRERDLPPTWAAVERHVEEVVATTLRRTATADVVLDTLLRPERPHRAVPHALWRLLRLPAGRAVWLGTAGLLGPHLRELLGLRWTGAHEAAFSAGAAASRASGVLLRGELANGGPRYVRLRAAALARGDVAAAAR